MVTTARAGQNTYTVATTGGTRVVDHVTRDVTEFMDALDRRDTPFTNSLRKLGPVNQRKHEWGIRAVTPRASTVGTTGLVGDTTIALPAGHGVRFQQGNVVRLTKADGTYEHLWVTADPAVSAITVTRARGGTVAIVPTAGDELRIVGVAMPELSDFTLGPVSRGTTQYNYSQRFQTMVRTDKRARRTPNEEYDGDWHERDTMAKAGDLKLNLEEALVLGRRQEGGANPAAPDPSMLGGLEQFADLSGNIFNVGGAATKLAIENIEDATVSLEQAIGTNAGTKLLMSMRTKQILNRIANNVKYESGHGMNENGTGVTIKWDWVELETGRYEFAHSRYIPEGRIFVYNPKYLGYAPYVGLDWHETDLSTKGDYVETAISGDFTFEAEGLPSMAVVYNFNTTLSAYPKYGSIPA